MEMMANEVLRTPLAVDCWSDGLGIGARLIALVIATEEMATDACRYIGVMEDQAALSRSLPENRGGTEDHDSF